MLGGRLWDQKLKIIPCSLAPLAARVTSSFFLDKGNFFLLFLAALVLISKAVKFLSYKCHLALSTCLFIGTAGETCNCAFRAVVTRLEDWAQQQLQGGKSEWWGFTDLNKPLSLAGGGVIFFTLPGIWVQQMDLNSGHLAGEFSVEAPG